MARDLIEPPFDWRGMKLSAIGCAVGMLAVACRVVGDGPRWLIAFASIGIVVTGLAA
jgi:hypothetical protein